VSYYLERIQRAVDYIEGRLDEDIELCSVAKVAGISQWHFQRIFKALTGETLKTYIRSRRLAGSLDRLLTSQLRILDIALLAGFESQESFARAFKQAFRITPQQYRSLANKSLFLKKPQFDAEYLRHINENVSLEPELCQQPRRTLVGLRTHFFSVDSEKNNIGERLPPLWQAFLSRLAEIEQRVPGVCYGVVRQAQEESELLEYHAAIEVAEPFALPDGMASIEIPPAVYAKFAHRGPAPRIDHTVSYIYSTWLARSGRRHSYGPDLEIYGAEYHPTREDSLMYYAIPIV
jgi:AraC family transcriptional regulator